jgi:hypothetical protein
LVEVIQSLKDSQEPPREGAREVEVMAKKSEERAAGCALYPHTTVACRY